MTAVQNKIKEKEAKDKEKINKILPKEAPSMKDFQDLI